ncbi:hypothetical protein MCOR31_010372 [Pyricularia oryzae]|uniref:Uncharacterized protein n=1 Tax=Pyricularia oryzae (strain P131) TaxID=1143193 RepID=L7JR56_PYRO1|nr:hypothetical protein MCOR31_010372 [Pyricularia oryzae]KAI6389528.1 hypothetical protein MCOR24_010559 [Pyricularia oryzae]
MEVILDAVRTAAHSTDPLETEEIEACIKQIKTILLVRKKVSSLNKKLGLRKLLSRLYSHQPDELVLPFKQLQCTQIVAIGLSVPHFELNQYRYKPKFVNEVVNELVVSAPHLQENLGSQIFDRDVHATIAGLQVELRSPDYTAFVATCPKPSQSPEHQQKRIVAPTSEVDPAASHTVPPEQASSIATSTTGLNQPVPNGLEPSPDGGNAEAVNSPASNDARQPQSQPNRKRRRADKLGGRPGLNIPPNSKDAVLNRRRQDRADIEYNTRKRHCGTSPPQPQPPFSGTWVADTVAGQLYSDLYPSAYPETTSTTFGWQQNLSSPGLPQDDHSLSTTHSAPVASYPIPGHVALSDVSPNVADKVSGNLPNPFSSLQTYPYLVPVTGVLTGHEIRCYSDKDVGFRLPSSTPSGF